MSITYSDKPECAISSDILHTSKYRQTDLASLTSLSRGKGLRTGALRLQILCSEISFDALPSASPIRTFSGEFPSALSLHASLSLDD